MSRVTSHTRQRIAPALAGGLLCIASIAGTGCRTLESQAAIEFKRIPEAGAGGAGRLEPIEGRVTGARPGQRIVLFAKSTQWWVQPFSNQPFTTIRADRTWSASTHIGTDYAALLVDPSYIPPATTYALPAKGGAVAAVAVIKGRNYEQLTPKTLQFGGYEWQIRHEPSDRGGAANDYSPANAWTDAQGSLHLRISRARNGWSCAEVALKRSLGYGSYQFVVRDVSQLEPAAVFSIFTWDDNESGQNHREMDIEVSRWGDASSKSAQYAIQPYYVPVNVVRFDAPAGVLTHTMTWEPGKVSFQTMRGRPGAFSTPVAENVFTSGVPSPGSESVRLNLYIYGRSRDPLKNETEVVVDSFEYLP